MSRRAEQCDTPSISMSVRLGRTLEQDAKRMSETVFDYCLLVSEGEGKTVAVLSGRDTRTQMVFALVAPRKDLLMRMGPRVAWGHPEACAPRGALRCDGGPRTANPTELQRRRFKPWESNCVSCKQVWRPGRESGSNVGTQ